MVDAIHLVRQCYLSFNSPDMMPFFFTITGKGRRQSWE